MSFAYELLADDSDADADNDRLTNEEIDAEINEYIDYYIKSICRRIEYYEPSRRISIPTNFKDKMNFCADRINYYIHKYRTSNYYNYQIDYNTILLSISGREWFNSAIIDHLKLKSDADYKIKYDNRISSDLKEYVNIIPRLTVLLICGLVLIIICIVKN